MHPPDIIAVLEPKTPTETVKVITLFSSHCGVGACASVSLDEDFAPPIPRPSPDAKIGYQLLQGPETNPNRVEEVKVDVFDDHIHVLIRVRGDSLWGAHGKYKGVLRVFWESDRCQYIRDRIHQLQDEIQRNQEQKAAERDPQGHPDLQAIATLDAEIQQYKNEILQLRDEEKTLGCLSR
jgi:hypothetical protein